MKVLTVVGARPQFIKAAPISRTLRQRHTEILVHTGQHYDANMSDVFFRELDIPLPDYDLKVGSGSHGAQTGVMLARLEEVMVAENPDWVLIYGDTNSTLAGALAAAKLRLPVAHVEAGLRSYNRRMPEEINRIVADHLSNLLLCPSQAAVDNLAAEGIVSGVHLVGDVMYDALLWAAERARTESEILERLDLTGGDFILATVHRAENTDDRRRLTNILRAFVEIERVIIFPVHPRTRRIIDEDSDLSHLLRSATHLRMIEPVGYLDMVRLEQAASLILTDSGGIQKEAYWLAVPCVTLRDETEWIETVDLGWNTLVGADPRSIIRAVLQPKTPIEHPCHYGEGKCAERYVALLEECLS